MRSYGIPDKLTNRIKEFYKDFKYSVKDSGETSEWFIVLNGVKQGCNMSGFFILTGNGLGNEKNTRWKPNWDTMEVYIKMRRSRFCR